jgi:hypothetical protein
MYCSTCGVAVEQGLSYCNYCGAKLSGAKGDDVSRAPEVKPGLLVSAIVALFVLGLAAIIMLMGMMKVVLRLDLGLILGFALMTFLIMLMIEGVFIRMLVGRKRGAEKADDTVQLKVQTTTELDAAQAGLLQEPGRSVTENTTRTFDPIYRERTSK